MSVLIRGMKMPKFCRSCRFSGFGGIRGELNVCMHTGQNQPILSPERMSECPLVELPLHGRLIDADALMARIWKAKELQPELSDVYEEEAEEMLLWVRTEPTVIEAEEADG